MMMLMMMMMMMCKTAMIENSRELFPYRFLFVNCNTKLQQLPGACASTFYFKYDI